MDDSEQFGKRKRSHSGSGSSNSSFVPNYIISSPTSSTTTSSGSGSGENDDNHSGSGSDWDTEWEGSSNSSAGTNYIVRSPTSSTTTSSLISSSFSENKWRDKKSWGLDYQSTFKRQPLSFYQVMNLRIVDGKYTNIRFERELGSGGFGSVWLSIVDERAPNGDITPNVEKACKVIPFQPIDYQTVKDSIKGILWEMKNIRGLNHPNLMLFDHCIPVPDSWTGFPYSYIALFMPVCHGDLTDLLYDSPFNQQLPPVLCKPWMKQVSEGLAYLHRNRIVHLDIKPANILFQFHDSRLGIHHFRAIPQLMKKMTFKLSDFGLSIKYRSNADMTTYNRVGTDHFMAPEMYNIYDPPCHQIYTTPCDVYSLGLTLADAYMGSGILYDSNQSHLQNQDDMRACLACSQIMAKIWDQQYIDYALISLIETMIMEYPEYRPSMEQVINDGWLQ